MDYSFTYAIKRRPHFSLMYCAVIFLSVGCIDDPDSLQRSAAGVHLKDTSCSSGDCFCVPNCAGKECGEDGCGGTCGNCPSGESCGDGVCVCTPDCMGKGCGDDGCGGSCGTCGQGMECQGGKCTQAECLPKCNDKECGDDGCGELCGTCTDDDVCVDGICCAPDCDDKECGEDGCKGTCGECSGDTPFCVEHSCVGECDADCVNSECGDDGCGGSCGECTCGDCGDGICTATAEVCDGYDNDCDEITDNGFDDHDDDGLADCVDEDDDNDSVLDQSDNCPVVHNPEQVNTDEDSEGDLCDEDDDNDQVPDNADCAPLDPDTHVGAVEACDGVDNNCDQIVDNGFPDYDEDGMADCVDEDDDADNVMDAVDNCVLDVNPGQEDLDQDGIGDACDEDTDGDGDPNATDCAPMDPKRFHGNEEACDGVDNDCVGGVPVGEFDMDEDGFAGCEGDCNDSNKGVYPGQKEDCDTAFDDNCDGNGNDEDALGCAVWYKDEDEDGFGGAEAKCFCYPKAPYTAETFEDCNDEDFSINPTATEDCTTPEVDENCDGSMNDQSALYCDLFYKDADEDGYGVPQSQCLCVPAGLFTADNVMDCDDTNPNVKPGVEEDCLTIDVDDNCNGTDNDVGALNCDLWFEDEDEDGYGVGEPLCICEGASVYSSPNGEDCNDSDKNVFPGNEEYCATDYDDNCNNDSNDQGAVGGVAWWIDEDGDGSPGTMHFFCEQPAGAADNPVDCCDTDSDVYPGQTKYYANEHACGGFDYNCNEQDEPQYQIDCIGEPCEAGWFGSLPGCGETGNWCLNCNGCGSCIGQTIIQSQKCR